jgi:hypothetical protein
MLFYDSLSHRRATKINMLDRSFVKFLVIYWGGLRVKIISPWAESEEFKITTQELCEYGRYGVTIVLLFRNVLVRNPLISNLP